MASPLLSVATVVVLVPPVANVPDAPPVGAVKTTFCPTTGLPLGSLIWTSNAPNAFPT